MKEKVFITGATGFIGSNIARSLVGDDKYEVHIICRSTSDMWRIKDITSKLSIHKLDITDKKRLNNLMAKIRPDIIFHLANIGVYGGFESDAESIMQVNFFGTYNLLEATKNLPYKLFVNTGSSAEYGLKNEIMRETDICEPRGAYAISKLSSTMIASDFAKKNNKQILNFRIFTPFGPFDNTQRLIPYVINQIINGQEIKLFKKNTVRDFIYIQDVVDVFIKAVDIRKKFRGDIINIGSGIETNVAGIIKLLIKISNSKSGVSWNNNVIRYESTRWQADIARAKNVLNWEPKYTLLDGLTTTYNWHKRR